MLRLPGAPNEPRILWQSDYADQYWLGYGPNLVLADMDCDGTPELVIASKPAYAGVLDSETGAVEFDLKYEVQDPFSFGRPDGPHIGRPYGLLHAADLDGDGYPDLVVAGTHVEEYIAVLRNEQGRGLSPAWTLFVEKGFPSTATTCSSACTRAERPGWFPSAGTGGGCSCPCDWARALSAAPFATISARWSGRTPRWVRCPVSLLWRTSTAMGVGRSSWTPTACSTSTDSPASAA